MVWWLVSLSSGWNSPEFLGDIAPDVLVDIGSTYLFGTKFLGRDLWLGPEKMTWGI